ncbi:protein SIEVE ELEMENT OCCLUSION B [Amborella trichopoda]|uniref:Sieve element occlusion N-terminal domain-containing protein n=1 Tax=Amborella trichopoda TaxID=13333 RepID=W1PTA1_AMBTC|nr:protein SIEVE ELEMENT OCCLUSION B [Amborella trichopoda]ERN10515.1 hypothetical protein AMTR_s00166p00029650 [Amborella trichopoda]|eukprot:XP_006848934.1 protein SIEVE ELEMENT OCCLUSION B [Amborella trichopoda]
MAERMKPAKGERHLFIASDDAAVMKQILATHSPDGREIDVKPLVQIVEDILKHTTITTVVHPQTTVELLEDKAHTERMIGMLEALAYTIHRISCEITCKCSGAGDAHATTLTLFNSLSNYSWDAKVVLVVAAFATSYGEFWLTAQQSTVNHLAKSLSLLKQLPDLFEHTEALKPRFEALNALVKAMLDVTKCIIEFKELPVEYINADTPAMTTAMKHIPTAAYWTIRSAVACATQVIGLIGMGHDYAISTSETWELSSLAHKVNNIHGHLRKQLEYCNQHIDERRNVEAYHSLQRLFEMIHIDNQKILRALFCSRDETPLRDGASQRKVSVDVLRRKLVILFVSDLEIAHEELLVLMQIYNDTHHSKTDRTYEVVWVPMVDRTAPWNEAKETAFNHLANQMPWFSLHHPSSLEPAVWRYIKEVWHFEKKPILVVLDHQGKIVCPNALHMILIWGATAYPFSSVREESLWKEETWRLEFLVDDIDPLILSWVKEPRIICLYGGEDTEWIRAFTSSIKKVIQETRVPIEMVYVGKSNPRERVRRIISAIIQEKLSGYWSDTMIWYFWVRLESMWHSKRHYGRTIDNDPIVQEVMSMLSFDGSDEGWAVMSRGSTEILKTLGKKLMECLSHFDTWKANITNVDTFIPALREALQPYHKPEHCTRLILPGTTGPIQEKVVCAECGRQMEKYVLYRCCMD